MARTPASSGEPCSDAVDGAEAPWMSELRRTFDGDVSHEEGEREGLLDKVPAAHLHEVVKQSRDMGAQAFKKRDWPNAYQFYNQAVYACDRLKDPDLVKVLGNRSACHLALGNHDLALRDASMCIKLDAGWQKAWYRAGRALYELKKYPEAEASFAEGIQLDKTNEEMLRWRQKARDRMREAKVHDMKVKRHSSDYTKFEDAIAEAEDPVGGGDGELAPASGEMGAGGAPICADVEELHELMQQKQRAELDNQKPVDVFYRGDMLYTPLSDNPPELQDPVGPFAAMVAYMQQMSALYSPQRAVEMLHTPVTRTYAEAIRYVGVQLTRLGLAGHWLHLGVGNAVPMMTTAGLAAPVSHVTGIAAHGVPYLDAMAHHLLKRHNLHKRATIIRQPVEQVTVASGGKESAIRTSPSMAEEAKQLSSPALILVIDPDLFDEGLLGRRVLPYVRHARRTLCIPTPMVVPSRARIFAMPIQLETASASGFDLRELDAYRWSTWYEEFDLTGKQERCCTKLAEPQEVFLFDFCAEDVDTALPDSSKRTLEFQALSSGNVTAVAFWFELQMVEGFDANIETSAGTSNGVWRQAIQWLDPVAVSKGATIEIEASHNSTRIRYQLLAPRRAAPIVHRHAIARWHFDMVADELRNDLYDGAIARAVVEMKAIRPDGRVSVVDFGTGSGLLAMMAARAGATRVTGFDHSGHIVEVAERVVKANGFGKSIKCIKKDCRHIEMGRDLPDRCDILIMELFDYGFLGEGALHFAHLAWNNVLKEDARIVPCGGAVFAMAVEILPRECEGLDVSMWNAYRFQTDYYATDITRQPHKRLTEPFRVFDFDFTRAAVKDRPPTMGGEWFGDLNVIKSGYLNAIIFWHEIRLDDEATISTAPDDAETCWLQAYQPMEEIELREGATLSLKAMHQGSRITFSVDREKTADFESMRTNVPFYDPAWLQTHNKLQEQSKDLTKSLAFSNESRQQCTDALVSISLDPARFGRKGISIDGSRAQIFLWSLFAD